FGERRREPLEVTVARGAECCAVGGGVLVDDLRADRRVYRDRHAEVLARDEHGHGASGERFPLLQVAGERLAHAALLAGAGGQRGLVDHETQVAGGEDVGEGAAEGGEAAVRAGGMGEVGGFDSVGTLGDGDGLEAAEVRLAVVGHGCSGTANSLSFSVTWPNENLDCNASMMRRSSSESHIRASAFSSKMPRPLGIAGRMTMAFHFCPATPTRSRPTTVTMTGLRSGRT